MKKFQRMKQQANEVLGRGEKSDKLTQKLATVEKKAENIRTSVQFIVKKLSGTIVGSGSSVDKHQRKLPQYSLGIGMMEHGSQLGNNSLFGSIQMMVGQAQQDIASQMASYEITIAQEIISVLNTMLEDDTKPVDRCKKKLGHARLDMDTSRSRLKNFEQQIEKSSREYNMEKLNALRTDADETSRKFEVCQDAYATSMYEFLSKEQDYTDKIQQLVKLQITNYKNAAVQLEGMLPVFEKKMHETQDRPVFGMPLEEHLRISKRDIAVVLETCCDELRREWMDTEGLFRIAGGQSKVKFLKTSLDAGQLDVSTHDPFTIGGCLKMYLRELPEPLLTYELYDEWMKAVSVADEKTCLTNLWAAKEKLPEANLNNFKYLCAFLSEFSQYSDITKMTIPNISIVIGPNLLWPSEDNADPSGMVTETALQRRITELFIDHCHYFFPDLAALSKSVAPTPTSPLTFTASSPTSYNSATLHSYTAKSSEFRPASPSSFGHSAMKQSDTVSICSSGSGDTTPSYAKSKEELHPLADSASEEGIIVNVVEASSSSPKLLTRTASSPVPPSESIAAKSRSLPRSVPPIPSTRSSSSNNITPPESPFSSHKTPPSPAPRSKHLVSNSSGNSSLGQKTPGAETSSNRSVSHDVAENGKNDDSSTPKPVPPPVRPRRAGGGGGDSTPPTPNKPPPYSGSPGSGTLERKTAASQRAPARKAPPPPKPKKMTASTPPNDELTSL